MPSHQKKGMGKVCLARTPSQSTINYPLYPPRVGGDRGSVPPPFREKRRSNPGVAPVARENKTGVVPEIKVPGGVLYPFDEQRMAFYCADLRLATSLRRRWPKQIKVFSQGDWEITLLFPTQLYSEVLELLKKFTS